ncbi:hypothetical protein CDAR_314551 [Caerostris darwini]|uniref:Uncharacterized protein n=1 Tax=Caerostris darwini TaxID=1538125 RepID=A0AAV4TT86_9ARAC|nr:hypothetical protein CDAR_314551 [Caerostris darwini]
MLMKYCSESRKSWNSPERWLIIRSRFAPLVLRNGLVQPPCFKSPGFLRRGAGARLRTTNRRPGAPPTLFFGNYSTQWPPRKNKIKATGAVSYGVVNSERFNVLLTGLESHIGLTLSLMVWGPLHAHSTTSGSNSLSTSPLHNH